MLGKEEAAVLMEHLPPVGWADVATKRDLDHFADQIRAELHREIGGLRAELHREIGGVRAELHQEVGGLRAELHRDLRDLQRNLFFGLLTAQAAFAGLVAALAG